MYKLLVLDMDGTLLKKDKTISCENLEAIKAAKLKNIKIALATGRPIKGIQKYLQQLNLLTKNDYAVTFNGAIIQNTKTHKIVEQNLMTLDDVKYLYNLSKKLNVIMHVWAPNTCITDKLTPCARLESCLNDVDIELKSPDKIDDSTPIAKVMFIEEESYLLEAMKKLPDEVYEKYTVFRSSPFFLEFLNKKANKGYGVQVLSKSLHIKRDEIICIGNASNDIHMIKYAGLGVAMGNGFSDVKEAADYITKSNQENGVAHVINKFILN